MKKRQRKKNSRPNIRLLPRCRWRKRYWLTFGVFLQKKVFLHLFQGAKTHPYINPVFTDRIGTSYGVTFVTHPKPPKPQGYYKRWFPKKRRK